MPPHLVKMVRFELLQLVAQRVQTPVCPQLGNGLGHGGPAGDGQWYEQRR